MQDRNRLLCCAGKYFVGSGNIGLNKHNGNIYGGVGLTKAGYDQFKGKLTVGASCMGFTLGEVDSQIDRSVLTDSALNGNSFGVAYGGPYGIAVGADMPVQKGKILDSILVLDFNSWSNFSLIFHTVN